MPEPSPILAPLHLQSYLAECPAPLAKVLRHAVEHPVSHLYALNCNCKPSVVTRVLEEAKQSSNPQQRRSASERIAALHKHHQERLSASGHYAIPPHAIPVPRATQDRGNCTLFAVETNDEVGIVRAFCRRCHRIFPVFDRALYWGVKRPAEQMPETWPYKCGCGGHMFEVGIGFDYTEDPIDENDIHTITVAVRCGACDQIALILDEEAT
jgi:hypothetical protein